jgi:hypothetical protein
MLQELVCTNLEPTDIADILFAIDVFDGESRTGSVYARDCAKVLQDLRSIVLRLKVPSFDPAGVVNTGPVINGIGVGILAMPDISHKAPDQGSGLSHGINGAIGMPIVNVQFPIAEGDALYQELVAWMDNDDLQLYGSYLI